MRFREYIAQHEAEMIPSRSARVTQTADALKKGFAQGVTSLLPGFDTAQAVGQVATDLWKILKGANADQKILDLMSQPDAQRGQNPLAALDVDDAVWDSLNDDGKNYMRDLLKAALENLRSRNQTPPANIGNQTVKQGLNKWIAKMDQSSQGAAPQQAPQQQGIQPVGAGYKVTS